MEEFIGTKGIWIADHKTVEFCDTGDYEYHATIEDSNGRCIAQFFTKNEDQREADCNLAAASPELLQSLQKLVEMVSSPCVINDDGFLAELDSEILKAKGVISKALGKGLRYESN